MFAEGQIEEIFLCLGDISIFTMLQLSGRLILAGLAALTH